MKLLDLYCGAGGAAMGYHRAGFEVVGVDINPQKHYPFEFHQGDAIEYLREQGKEFDVIHASPPCQRYSKSVKKINRKNHPDLIFNTRTQLITSCRPYIIENVPGSPLINPIVLCGTMFGLDVKRHRLFESNAILTNPPQCLFFLHNRSCNRYVLKSVLIAFVMATINQHRRK
jgi:DNA (cytosine-5)-methyltransferase 1